jgi:hypothetical protein
MKEGGGGEGAGPGATKNSRRQEFMRKSEEGKAAGEGWGRQ